MTGFTNKFVIGLTGNIGSGKSQVLSCLAHLGALTIDADQISRKVMQPGTPVVQEIIQTFGNEMQNEDGTIHRQKLGNLVFNDPTALKKLESITHPAIHQQIEQIIQHSDHPVIAIEAIKLFESGLASVCNSIWVVQIDPDIQMERLIHQRGMTAEDARQRITSQSRQEEKISRANIVIDNSGDWESTQKQIYQAWKESGLSTPTDGTILV